MNKALILSDKLKQMNIDISFDEDQRHFEGSKRKFKKKVLCSRNIILIAPDGDRFHCVSKLMRQKQSIENIFDSKLSNSKKKIICDEYGYCAPCDYLGETEMEFIT